MSANVLWSPVANGIDLPCWTPESFRVELNKVFERDVGTSPVRFTAADLPQLDTMAKVLHGGSTNPNAYAHLARIIREHGDIELWLEY